MKWGSHQYGLLVPHEAKSVPWSDVATNCIGPWMMELQGGQQHTLCALAMIDIMINLLEITLIITQTSEECA